MRAGGLAAGVTQATGLVVALVLFTADFASAAEPSPAPAVPLRVASRSLDAASGALTLGRPVIVTRSDVESPLGRVRSLDLEPTTAGSVHRADPAFKAVLLTPRESTGRPAQPVAPDLAPVEPHNNGAPAKTDVNPKGGMTPQSYSPPTSEPHPPREPSKSRTPPRGQQSKGIKEHAAHTPAAAPARAAAAPTRAAAAPARAAAAPARKVTAAAPAARYGAAEIAATRAFTRF